MKTIALHVTEAKSLLEKSLGLINRDPVALLFRTRFGIHTFGLRYPIDVVILDKHFRVVKLKESLKPNNIFLWNVRFNIVIELPEGTIAKKGIVEKQIIELTYTTAS